MVATSSTVKSRRALFVAIGYLPVLVVGAGVLYWILRSSLQMILGLATLSVASRDLALTGLAMLSTPVIAVGVTCAYLHFADKSRLRDLGLGWRTSSIIVLAIGLIVSMVAVAVVFTTSSWLEKTVVYGLASPTVWAVLASLGMATQAGWVEELVCRGVILQKVEEGVNRPIAIVISSMLFVLFHLFSPFAPSSVHLLYLVLISFTLTAAYYVASRQLWLPIGIHWGIDLMTFLLIGSNVQRQGALLNWRVTGFGIIAGANFVDWLLLGSLLPIWLFLGIWWWHNLKVQAA